MVKVKVRTCSSSTLAANGRASDTLAMMVERTIDVTVLRIKIGLQGLVSVFRDAFYLVIRDSGNYSLSSCPHALCLFFTTITTMTISAFDLKKQASSQRSLMLATDA